MNTSIDTVLDIGVSLPSLVSLPDRAEEQYQPDDIDDHHWLDRHPQAHHAAAAIPKGTRNGSGLDLRYRSAECADLIEGDLGNCSGCTVGHVGDGWQDGG